MNIPKKYIYIASAPLVLCLAGLFARCGPHESSDERTHRFAREARPGSRTDTLARISQRSLTPTTQSALTAAALAQEPGFFKWMEPEIMTHLAAQSGNWDDPKTWGGSVPGKGARVYIPEGITVKIGDLQSEHIKSLRVDGVLTLDPDNLSQLTVDSLLIADGGALIAGTESDPIPASAEVMIELKAYVDGATTGADLAQAAQIIVLGDIQLHGQPKTGMATIKRPPLRGDRELVLDAPPVNWVPGDMIVLGGNQQMGSETEILQVESVSGRQVRLQPASGQENWGGLAYDYTPNQDQAAFAVNLTRNVAVSTPAPPEDTARNHPQGTLIIENSGENTAALSHISSVGLGMEEGILPGHDHTLDRAAISVIDDGTGSGQSSITGLALVNGPEVPVRIQNTQVTVKDSVSFNEDGSGWLTETGSPSHLIWSAKRTVPTIMSR